MPYVAARIILDEHLSFDDVLIRPLYSEVRSRDDVSLVTELSSGLKLDLPLLAANMDTVCGENMAVALAELGGIGVLHRKMIPGERLRIVKTMIANDHKVGVAVGVHTLLSEIMAYVDCGASMIVLDIAHGDSAHALDRVHQIRSVVEKRNSSICVMGGNVATPEAVYRMYEAGAHSVKVGIGPGSACTTRTKTGVGVPQVTTILECSEVADECGISCVADGGMKTPGDIAKALALGADAVMVGGMLSGTDEAPGRLVTIEGERFKEFRGMASKAVGSSYEEGASGMVPHKGSAESIVSEIGKGLRSAFSYSGASNIEQFHLKAELIKISMASVAMSKAHGLSND
jgi:IMP dehydrogenase